MQADLWFILESMATGDVCTDNLNDTRLTPLTVTLQRFVSQELLRDNVASRDSDREVIYRRQTHFEILKLLLDTGADPDEAFCRFNSTWQDAEDTSSIISVGDPTGEIHRNIPELLRDGGKKQHGGGGGVVSVAAEDRWQ